jgi:hypothetical protein
LICVVLFTFALAAWPAAAWQDQTPQKQSEGKKKKKKTGTAAQDTRPDGTIQ